MASWKNEIKCSLGYHEYGTWFEIARLMGTDKSLYVRTCSCCKKEDFRTKRAKRKSFNAELPFEEGNDLIAV
jgi:hypothetical protein